MTNYEPELGQAIFGNPTGEYKVPKFAVAFCSHVLREIDRVYWNRNQKQWDPCYGTLDPQIPGVEVFPYWWGDEDAPEALRPNFKTCGLELRWYKYFGRGMSCNVEWTEAEWRKWMDDALRLVRRVEHK